MVEMRKYHEAEPIADILARLSLPVTECGCYAWLGKLGTGGYAYVNYRIGPQKRLTRKAATVAWELENASERPQGMEIHHTCHSRWCVNPDHLVLATRGQNSGQRRRYTLPLRRRSPEERRSCQAEWRASNKDHIAEYARANKDRINAQRRERRARKGTT